ncbi:nicotianamine synthase family protein [Photobacterium sp. 1_MG-2023]|uniref:nicotianamine synthase family protein n=1 Tax=Photobacterium sp. 1_MG-2023 TaxID=3062646 RepID=UPI0026E2EA51|nr:nicotianamine synthase family protein [Photobacterium sp. 1_MG-2023]MDO6706181.1 nicotianamine synthase family protein [Photobacterium sp. 1_MG-2023]
MIIDAPITQLNDKYKLLTSLIAYEAQLDALVDYSLADCECYSLLQQKLDELCNLIADPDNLRIWHSFAQCAEIDRQIKTLRETAMKSLCLLEKHQSRCAINHALSFTHYLDGLNHSASCEIEAAQIHRDSRVLFIGSGAYPLSAITIATLTQATVKGLDIDPDAVRQARQLDTAQLRISFEHTELTLCLAQFQPTHIVIASLVEHKWEVLSTLRPSLTDSQKVLVRYGNGLKSAFNYPFNASLSLGWRSQPVHSGSSLYDVVLMEKAHDN